VLKTLYAKLLAVLVGLSVIMAVIFVVVIRHSDVARNQEVNQKLYRNLAARLIDEQILSERDSADPAAVQRVFDRIRVVNPRIDVYLLDNAGHVVAASVQDGMKTGKVDLEPIRKFFDENAKLPILGDDPSDPGRRRVFSVAPVPLPGAAPGYLYLMLRGLSGDTLVQRIKQSYVLRETLLLIGSALAVALLASALIITFMTRPLRQLTAVMDKFRVSGFADNPEAARPPTDEVTTLTHAFNSMADRILEQMRALQETDAKRREFVANISHDLRTPLATLQGYLETLHLKQAHLSPEEQRAYLGTALKQTEQLSGLVGRLFDLARLDSGQTPVNAEPFALGDLVQDVAQEFDLAAQTKGITLKTAIRQDLPLAYGDIALLERVLRNLMENALRYTASGGAVTLSAAPHGTYAIVEVTDTGIGIPSNELPRIFERFYRVEKSRGLSEGNAGLGLAIAKRILDLHESTITVRSKPGQTVFRFNVAYAAVQPSAPARDTAAYEPAESARRVPAFTYPMADPSA
jgi:two-component system OmpR family sensor kinase